MGTIVETILDLVLNPVAAIIAVIVVLVGTIWFVATNEMAQRETFMAECIQHRENYECIAMWRAGNNHTTFYPIVIPVR